MTVWLYRLAALAVPVATSVALGLEATRPIPPCGAICAVTAQVDHELEQHPPRLVVVGNSMARRDVNLRRLAEGLGYDPDEAALLALPGSSPGTWYAVLHDRLFQAGHRPELVVVLGAPRSFWITRPALGADVAAMVQIAGSDDPVLRRVQGELDPVSVLWSRVDLHRRIWRTAIVGDGVAALGALAGDLGIRPGDEADDVFGVAGGDPGALRNVLGGPTREDGAGLADTVEETFLPAILAEVTDHGARLVVAGVPPRGGSGDFGETLPEREEALGGWLERNHATWLPMDDVVLPRKVYADQWHLQPEGAKIYTDALVEAIRAAPRSVAGPAPEAGPG